MCNVYVSVRFYLPQQLKVTRDPIVLDLEYSGSTWVLESTRHTLTKSLILTNTSPHKPHIIIL
jgi:hypothetical protein